MTQPQGFAGQRGGGPRRWTQSSWSKAAVALAAVGLTLSFLAACSNGGGTSSGLPTTALVAPITQVYRFGGSATIQDAPVEPGVVTARWYQTRGWYVAIFEGLDPAASGPLCIRTSFFNRATNQLERAFTSPTSEGACDNGGASLTVPPAQKPSGIRVCEGLVSFVTSIPAELEGTLVAALTRFAGDGTGVEILGRVESTGDPPGSIDESLLSCGPLPAARAMATPTPQPTPAPSPVPASTGSVAAVDRARPPTPAEPASCAHAESGVLQDVTETEASPYLVHHPAPDIAGAPTIVFLGGGSGRKGSAERLWENIFADAPGTNAFRVVIPYSVDADFIDESSRTFAIVNEVLWCYGGDPAAVHLAGTSNGGLAAFALMLKRPELFATLLGAPGAFPVQDPSAIDPAAWSNVLAGRAVFNGVGANDVNWRPEVIATHNALAAAGVESVFVEFPGQGHILTGATDETVFFDFWNSH